MSRKENVCATKKGPSCLEAAGVVNVLLRRRLVLADKVRLGVLAEPVAKLANLLAKADHGLLVHVGLGQKLRK